MRQMTTSYRGPGRPQPLGGRALLVATLLVTTLALAFAVGVAARSHVAGKSPARQQPAEHAAITTDQQIATLQERLRQNPDDVASEVELAAAYLQKIRDTADPAYYPKALATIQDALKRAPNDPAALAWMGGLQLSLHNFQAGLDWGTRAHAANPDLLAAYPVLIDANVELGRYDEAARLANEFVGLKPGLPSYTRVSYLRELFGDRDGAIAAMQLALEAAPDGSEAEAWTRVQLGNLEFNGGDLASAQRDYERTLATMPDYGPAVAGLANVAAARGDFQAAVDLLTPVVERVPLPQYVILLGDIYAAAGNQAAADEQYALVRVETQLLASNGVNSDLEVALFESDHPDGATPQQTVDTARAALAARPSIYGHDTLAWALYRAGDYAAAQAEIQQALMLGTQDALLHFHAGAIAQARGDLSTARTEYETALGINPYFSLLHAPEARAALDLLGRSR